MKNYFSVLLVVSIFTIAGGYLIPSDVYAQKSEPKKSDEKHDEHDHDHSKEEPGSQKDKAGAQEKKAHTHTPGEKHDEEESDGHDHDKEENHDHASEDSKDKHGHSHGKETAEEDHDNEKEGGEEGHDHGKGGHEEEESGVIGPDKGITAKGKNGFTLSKEAWISFDLKTQSLDSGAAIPKSAVVSIKDGKYYYRIRDGWIKRVPMNAKLQKGDQVITSGTGFVRTAELVVEEGVSHGHSH